MRLRIFLLGAAVLAAAWCGACRTAPPNAASWRLSLQTVPTNPAAAADTQFQLRVLTSSGQPLDGAVARVDLVMATMDMGTTPVSLPPQGHGLYAGTGQFAMEGDWNCRVTVTLGGRSQTQVFHYKIG